MLALKVNNSFGLFTVKAFTLSERTTSQQTHRHTLTAQMQCAIFFP